MGNIKLIAYGALSIFFTYGLVQKFNLFGSNESSWHEKLHACIHLPKTWLFNVKKWIWVYWTILKLFRGDGVTTCRIIYDYFISLKDTPHDISETFFRMVYVDKPNDLQVVLNNSNALGKSSVYRFFKDSLGEGLISAPVEKWRKNRRIVSPLFTQQYVKGYSHIFNAHSSDLVEQLKKYSDTNEYFDLWIPVSETTLRTIWHIVTSTDMDDLDILNNDKENSLTALSTALDLLGWRLLRLWLHSDILFKLYTTIAGYGKYLELGLDIPKKVLAAEKEKFKETLELVHDSDGSERNCSFIHQCLKKNEEGAGLTDIEITDESITLLVAGSETNALTISFTILMLAMNPGIQEKVYKEIIKYSGNEDHDVGLDQVQGMTYLDQCVRETLRLYSPVPFVIRQATESFQINENYTIQKNSHIIIPILMVHRRPDIYPNPLQWNPENFSAENVDRRHKYSFLAFSAGPRGCIGDKYSSLAVKITLSKILKNYRFVTDLTTDDIVLKLDLVLRNATGYKVKMFPRK